MRVFVCEFVTGGGLVGQAMPAGLAREGDMMLRALVGDLADVPGIEVVFPRDARLGDPGLPGRIRWIGQGDDPWRDWAGALAEVDAGWPVAPESAGVLERLSGLVLGAGRTLLACPPAAVRQAASKRLTAQHLVSHGIAALPGMPLPEALAHGLPPAQAGWVVKPDDGAGAEDTLLFRSAEELAQGAPADPAGFIVQPYLPGRAASLSLLCADGRAALLSCNLQDVRIAGGRFRFHGSNVGGSEEHRGLYAPLAARIAAALPDLWGHVGVDLVEATGGPVVLEINPRLTTSYVGLRRALGRNPAALALELLGRDLPAIALPTGRQSARVDVDVDGAAA